MNRILLVYDDSQKPGRDILQIVGDKPFSDIIYKRKTIKGRTFEILSQYDFIIDKIILSSIDKISGLVNKLSNYPSSLPVFHMFSDSIISNPDEFDILINKTKFVKQNICVFSPSLAGVMFHSTEDYIRFLKNSLIGNSTRDFLDGLNTEQMKSDAFTNIDDMQNFIKYITGGFDARFFNRFSGDDYIITKKSSNRLKIKSEYTYFQLLPEQMRMWFVMPFNYQETEDIAGYSMERYHMPDLAIRWVHRSISVDEFEGILNKLFVFLNSRSVRPITAAQYRETADELYLVKLDRRMNEVKKSPYFGQFQQFISSGTRFSSLEEIIGEYKLLYKTACEKGKFKSISVIGHGDFCFSNMLYDKETSMLKLLDPKGALTEPELWTDPYYDAAKLSHSICGKYDFFNSGLFDCLLDEDLKFKLLIEFDNAPYIELFKKYLAQNGYDYACVRLFEASLFLSMLPLHMDYPQKVFGFLLNAINIMEEVRLCWKM